ncbi:MAG: hypothetical protein JST73_06160 [Actinobacteria bacterium]|nr:hypothetical protein [Actinomycetota bacterium]
MNPLLPEPAVAFGESARRAFGDLGGIDRARRAEHDHDHPDRAIADALGSLGVDDLSVTTDTDAAAAGAVACIEAGRVVLPWPVAGWLTPSCDGSARTRPFALVDPTDPAVDHGATAPRWEISPGNGRVTTATPGTPLATRLGPFVTRVTPTGGFEPATGALAAAAWWSMFTSCRILGALERALEVTVEHTSARHQFGRPLTAFQTVRFALADAKVEVAGLRELSLFTLWRLGTASVPDAHVDALALRMHALDTARGVLRTCRQLHGAAGVCDEYEIAMLGRHLQPTLRLPDDADTVAVELAGSIRVGGFDGLFDHAGHR